MKSFLVRYVKWFAFFGVLDVVATGMGMGVPVVAIALGFPAGYTAARRFGTDDSDTALRFGRVFSAGLLLYGFTMLMMAVIWIPSLVAGIRGSLEITRFGHPFFLYDPRMSFYGWMVLMIFVSPVLQLMAFLSAAFWSFMRGIPAVKSPAD